MSSATSEISALPPRSIATMPSMAISMFDGRALLAGFGIEPEHPAAGFDLARLGQLHAQNAQIAPCDSAPADRRVEDRVPVPRHFTPPYPAGIITPHKARASGILRLG